MNNKKTMPDSMGRFGMFGGRYVPETLMKAIDELELAYIEARKDEGFFKELEIMGKQYIGRPTPLTYAENLTRELGGAKIFLKREDLSHTGAHKINNALGQALLTSRMGKNRVIAETGAGQHGVAVATVCAMLKQECVVYMGSQDIKRQALNVFRMKLLGADVRSVDSGSKTLKDAINECIRDWVTNVDSTHYLIGSVVGPHPYPMIVRDFQSVIGAEAHEQILDMTGKLPDYAVGCGGDIGVLHGSMSYLLQDDNGQVMETHSVSAGLDYPGVGPEHSWLKDSGRATYVNVTDSEALEGLQLLCKTEGIIPALETAHAIYYVSRLAPTLSTDRTIVLNLSGRGDKDMESVASELGFEI